MNGIWDIQAVLTDGELSWKWVAKKKRMGIQLDEDPAQSGLKFKDGDVWKTEYIKNIPAGRSKVAVLKLLAKKREMQDWEKIKDLPDHYVPHDTLMSILILLNVGKHIALIGPKGTGKSTLMYRVADSLGWQIPCKVDVPAIKKPTDLFGSDAAANSSTVFKKSAFYYYIERACRAHELGLPDRFVVILDEMNRAHSKANEAFHSLLDDLRQVSFTTTEGSKLITVPPNVSFVATMNIGQEYQGVYQVDAALKDRFTPSKISPMPFDIEVDMLHAETGLLKHEASRVVMVAHTLRKAERNNVVSFSPSYRGCTAVAEMMKHGMSLRIAVIQGMLGWYDGELEITDRGDAKNPNTEIAKAYAALRKSDPTIMKNDAKDSSKAA